MPSVHISDSASNSSCAISAFHSAPKLDPSSWEAHFNLGLTFLDKGDTQHAAEEFSYLLRKNHSAKKFGGEGAKIGWLCGGLMGLFWFGGQALYGFGISHMGNLGVVIGWPLLMGMIIITSNAAGVVTGEWDGASTAGKRFLAAGMVIILVALGVLAVAQRA